MKKLLLIAAISLAALASCSAPAKNCQVFEICDSSGCNPATLYFTQRGDDLKTGDKFAWVGSNGKLYRAVVLPDTAIRN